MKTIPPPCPEPDTGPKYWRSLNQLAETPEFQQMVEREFPSGASELSDPVSRRYFVKIMSASALLAGVGLTGCRRPEEKILPFSKQPENYIHGVAQYFATARPTRNSAVPLLAKSNDGRPTKVEPNIDHPVYKSFNAEAGAPERPTGGTDAMTQASILNLYDPDRATSFKKNGNVVSAEEAIDALAQLPKKFTDNEGDGLCFLLDQSSSPSRARLRSLISEKFKQARWYSYEPVDFKVADFAASELYYRKTLKVDYRFENAKRILSLDCDFIGAEQDNYRHIRGFVKGRRLNESDEKGNLAEEAKKAVEKMNRLYVVEGLFTLTGANADHRLRVPTSQILAIAARVATEVQRKKGNFLQDVSQFYGAYKFSTQEEKWIIECVNDLAQGGSKSLVVAGYRQPPVVHMLAHLINQLLGSLGETVVFYEVPASEDRSIVELTQRLAQGKVDTLIMVGGNPVYNAPVDLNFPEACKQAKDIIRLGYYEDETAPLCTWHIPAAHYLESWGDVRTGDGTICAIQPLIEPLFGGMRELEFLARVGGLTPTSSYEIVRDTFQAEIHQGKPKDSYYEQLWKRFLNDGFVGGTAYHAFVEPFPKDKLGEVFGKSDLAEVPNEKRLELVYYRDAKVDDGRYNNNGWLQEMPDPITKMTWENVVLMSYKTAKNLNLVVENKENNDLQVPLVKLRIHGREGGREVTREIQGPVWVQPGMADNSVAIAFGYGRTRTGRVGQGSGFNAYALRTSYSPYFESSVEVVPTGQRYPLATTQDHWSMEGRPIIREANAAQFIQKPDFAKAMRMEEPPLPEGNQDGRLYPNPLDEAKQKAVHWWGMSIDLNACVGCGACMMACQSENNIPIVGKWQVRNNREMHWIRIDRYYTSILPWKDSAPWSKEKDREAQYEDHMADPQMIHQPMLCQHCEKAPCENVCPVNATAHDQEGLNVMVYNRCVGTRYCSNNCPYKVRRFNYFDYNKRTLEMLKGEFVPALGAVYPTPMTHSTEGEWDMKRWVEEPESGYKPEEEWELTKLVKNPQVTVRMRGVMEKCSFCLQRIEQAKITQKVKARASAEIEVPDGAFTTACSQACPAEAIVFGNIKDPNSRVSKLKNQQRDYKVLEFLATQPRLTYLAKVRNPNPAMPDPFAQKPGSLQEYLDAKNENPFEGHEGGEKGESHAAPERATKGEK